MDSLDDFVLVHKTTMENFKKIEDDGFLLGRSLRPDFKLHKFYSKLVKSKKVSPKKRVFFSLLSKEIKYEPDFLNEDDVLLIIDPKIIQDYEFVFNPSWTFGFEMKSSLKYEHRKDLSKKEELLYNLNKMNKLVIDYYDSSDSYFYNELVIDADTIPLDKYLKNVLTFNS